MRTEQVKKWAGEITRRLRREYPDAAIALNFETPLELLVATILSAQSTDRQINKITADLFRKYRQPGDYARAKQDELEVDIRSSGFFRNKAKNIIAAARKIEADFGGEVPSTMEALVTLPGVARKTANIVLYHAFGKTEGIAVDTHVKRLAGRLGLSAEKDPVKIERDLMKLLPRRLWGPLNYLLIEHGRRICRARKPRCGECVLKSECPAGSAY
jgi:endonuclease-3